MNLLVTGWRLSLHPSYRDMVRAWRAFHTTRPVLMERHTGQTLLTI